MPPKSKGTPAPAANKAVGDMLKKLGLPPSTKVRIGPYPNPKKK